MSGRSGGSSPRRSGCASPRAPPRARAAAGCPAAAARASSCRCPAGPRAAGCAARRPRARARGARAPGRGRRRGRAAGAAARGRSAAQGSGGSRSPRRYATASARCRTGPARSRRAPPRAPTRRRRGAAQARARARLPRRASTPPTGRSAAVERELADRRVLGERVRAGPARRGEHRERDRQVEAGALLAQRRRREVDGDPPRGHSSSADAMPLRTRCFASWQARSARPTIVNAGRPLWTCASTSTRRGSRPTSAWVTARASTLSTLRRRGARVCAELRRRLSALARDEHVFEELAGPPARAPVDVAAVARLEPQARRARGSPGRGRGGR